MFIVKQLVKYNEIWVLNKAKKSIACLIAFKFVLSKFVKRKNVKRFRLTQLHIYIYIIL